ncbi:LuxR C-terminal-related transcriptional regulator [Actinosynnema sp. NPDC047251]|uniref:Transcriptional regulator n=1 Tax=Saccharothrix espanaensis (strain ATCC 51144 / DSM 44229 / JCM 9112 / NBRC 15066 / NRRL 15764) TaxID=1179773 RepID=K0K9R4_SACES|nr:LuxR C-terminal-related transcriptional regulator [Saccharothrix espanaensis]CCH33544.1 Transcriptional regulator [Saccharothrix espanaensis DSM 44229]
MSKSHGRDREWASVLRFLTAPGGLLAIDGPPCSGKTSLLHEAADAARDRGYGVVLVPADRVARSAELAHALERAPDDTPDRALVAIDHAHRDPDAVLALLPRLRERRVTALVALTGAHAGNGLCRALAADGEVLTLGPVDADVVDRMLVDLLGAPPRPDLAELVAAAAGDPRMITELITGLREEGRLDTHDGTTGALPRRVGGLVRGRVDVLSAKTTQLLRVAAVIGRSFRPHDAAALMGETTGALLLSVDELIASGLVRSVGDRLEFDSELVWRAVVESIPDSVLHALRRDATALRAAFRAVPDEPLSVDDRGSAAVRGVRTLAANGRLGSAIALARDSLARDLPAGPAAELHTALAGILLADGRPADAAAEMERALAAPAAASGPCRRLAAAGRLLSLYFATGSRAGAHALSVLTARDREASDADVVMAATVHSCLEWTAGNLAEGVYWGRESTRWELDAPTAWWQSQAAVAFALKLSALGEFEPAEELVRGDGPDTDDAVTAGAPAARMIARARVLTQAGKLVAAQVAAHSGMSLARDRGLRLLVPLASTVLATVALHRGDVPAAAEHVRRYRGDLAGGEAVLHSGQYDWVELLLAHAQDGPARAAGLARARLADLGSARRMLVEEPGAAPWLVRQALAAGDSGLAGEVVAAAEELAAGNPGFAAVSVGASHARALLDHDDEALLAAAGRHRHPWARANANEDLAAVLAESGRTDRADAALTAALRIFDRMGADAEAARLRRRTDAPPPSGGTAPGTSGEDWRRLSEPERDLARLVGAGLTNRQVARQLFLSPHTVNYHLRGIFKKLGICSRVELARLALEQEHAEV